MEKVTENIQFTKDKPVIILAIVSGFLALINVIQTLIRLKPNDFKVPVQYIVNDGSVLQSSSWYSLYSLALFSILGAGVMIFVAHRLHKGNRIFAIGALLVYVIVALVTLLASSALLDLVSGV